MALDIQRNIRHSHMINSVVLGHVSLLSTFPLAARRCPTLTIAAAAASAIWHLKSSLLSSYESSNITVSISSHKNGNNTLFQCLPDWTPAPSGTAPTAVVVAAAVIISYRGHNPLLHGL